MKQLAILLLALSALPARANDAAEGRAVVAKWCKTCHSIEGTETDPNREPTFQEIANRPGRDAESFR